MPWHEARLARSINYKRVMLFVDGTNFLETLNRQLDFNIDAYKPPHRIFELANRIIQQIYYGEGYVKIRNYWFASYQSNDQDETDLREQLRWYGYEPILFQKKGNREKGVDISLTLKVLLHAINSNYDIAYLIAGDEDYLELIREVKRHGPNIYGGFFSTGLSPAIKTEFDEFHYLDQCLEQNGIIEFTETLKQEIQG